MNARDELARIIASQHTAAAVEEILAAGYRKPRTITTAEEIKDLPALTMVVHDDMANGGPLEAYVVPDDGTVMFKDRYPFHLLCMNGEYVNAEDMPLPLTVVYEVGSVTAPALPRPDLAALQAAATAADQAYTQAVREAAQTRNWYGVPPAAHAYKQARAAVTASEQDRA